MKIFKTFRDECAQEYGEEFIETYDRIMAGEIREPEPILAIFELSDRIEKRKIKKCYFASAIVWLICLIFICVSYFINDIKPSITTLICWIISSFLMGKTYESIK